MKAEISPGPIMGTLTVPSSKSHTIRALLIATMTKGRSVIRNPLYSEDCLTAAKVIQQFGASLTKTADDWVIDGVGKELLLPRDIVNVNNSGTTLYFVTSLAALLNGYTLITGDQSIRKRPIQPLLDALNVLGATSSTTSPENSSPPFFIKGKIKGGKVKVSCKTSQYISSLMLAAPLCEGTMEISTDNPREIPYLQMTIKWLEDCGIKVIYDSINYQNFLIPGQQKYQCFDKTIPGDWSSVAFPVVAALANGSDLNIGNMDFKDTQGDAIVIDHLIGMGANIQKNPENGELQIHGSRGLHGTTIDLKNTPDALPILSVAACLADGTTILNNVAGAREKETDRVEVMTSELKKMGADICSTQNTVVIQGGKKLEGSSLESHGDHRIAMALTVGALSANGTSVINQAECASVTFPAFYEKLQDCGAQIKMRN